MCRLMFRLLVEDEEEREKEQQVLVSVVVLYRLGLAIVATSECILYQTKQR